MPTESDPPHTTTDIGDILVSSRSLAEYRAMFALTDEDLRRRILDCPGGTAGFTAEVCAAGGDATACDPIYGQHTPAELVVIAQRESARGNRHCRRHSDEYVWTFFSDPDHHDASRSEAGRRFGNDHGAHSERYAPGALPHLPFEDQAFDLVLSSHLLFSYADRLNLLFHHRAARELIRIAATEVRIFPLVTLDSTEYPHLDVLRQRLADDGITTDIRGVDYEFQTGADSMLVCTRSSEQR